MSILNEIISDTDNEIERVCFGMEISRAIKRKNVFNDERRAVCKHKLTTGIYTPLEYLKAISNTIGKVNTVETEYSDISEESEVEEELSANEVNICAVILVRLLGYSYHVGMRNSGPWAILPRMSFPDSEQLSNL